MTAVQQAVAPPPALAAWNRAGVLDAIDVHVAATLARIARRTGRQVEPQAELGFALACRAPRSGHACVDLARVGDAIPRPEEVGGSEADHAERVELPAWPDDVAAWVAALHHTGLVTDAASAEADVDAALVLDGTRLYLRRHWDDERSVAARLECLLTVTREPGAAVVRAVLDRLFSAGGRDDAQRAACARSFDGALTVIAGGPGTGKTYTVTRLVAAHLQAAADAGRPAPRIALAAPTGKAAARLDEAVREGAGTVDVDPTVHQAIAALSASTIHRLLAPKPGSRARFRHHADDRLDVDLVVVDEVSMVSLALMARLLEALPDTARIVLIGDPDQLQSVEAGTVLGDVLGPTIDIDTGAPERTGPQPLADRIVVLRRPRRFSAASPIAALAEAVRSGAAATARDVLGRPSDGLRWVALDDAHDPSPLLEEHLRPLLRSVGARQISAGRCDDAQAAAVASAELQVLCAHRRGPLGVTGLTRLVERWLADDGLIRLGEDWYPGRPVLLTRNDHRRGLYNGDSGVVLATDSGPHLAVPGRDGTRRIAASRVGDVETAWAVTIHKSQGSQYDHVVVILPDAESRLLTRELLYTAITRARSQVTILGPRAALERGVERRVPRVGGLRAALWDPARVGRARRAGHAGSIPPGR